ncbi:pentapeptide repeat-containing protein [Serratia marcescens VGH107]|nr:pentapeptide repeat-containing protein [Serratia marcescens VGH107]
MIALLDMGQVPQLRPEMELWQLAAQELKTNAGMIDMAIPKAHAEFLATGNAYTYHQHEKTTCEVCIDIERLSKTLVVFGDRILSGKHPISPRSFDCMPLDWTHAFGGANSEENPHGIGATEEQEGDSTYRCLPNIEVPCSPIMMTPQQQPEPASFGPLELSWPRRFRHMGEVYDADWLKNDFPGLADDADWSLFNAASPDQWWLDQDVLPPEAEWRIRNMHPQKPVQTGKLPPWQARCFINRQRGDETLFEEVALRATTVWFFPHHEQMMLIWQGSHRINEDDATDVLQLMPALEKVGASRSVNHYRKVLTKRLDKEKGALFAFREKDLVPEEVVGLWIDSNMQQSTSPIKENLHNKVNQLREQHRTRLEQQGSDIGAWLVDISSPDIPSLDELPEFIERLEQHAEEMKAQAEVETLQGAKLDNRTRGPESMYRMQEILHQHADNMTEKQRVLNEKSLHGIYLMSVQHQPPAICLTGDIAQIIRQRAANTMACGGDFRDLDFTGADLSGMDFRGADFRNVLLENADLSGCLLDGTDFSEAVLARVNLCNSSLREANLTKASLAGAKCRQTDFSGAILAETQLDEALFEGCDFSHATLKTLLLLREMRISRCRFQQASLDCCIFMKLMLSQLDFSSAKLHKTVFHQCELDGAIFNCAWIESCNWVDSKLPLAQFKASTLLTCAAVMAVDFTGVDFSGATLKESNFRGALMVEGNFMRAKLDNTDFSEANCQWADFTCCDLSGSMFIRTDFRHANFTGANLMETLLQKTQLGSADFTHANLFRADISQSLTNAQTLLDNAYVKRVKTLPRRDGELA